MLLLAIVLWVQKKSIAFGVDDGKSSIIDLHIKVLFYIEEQKPIFIFNEIAFVIDARKKSEIHLQIYYTRV